MKIAYCTIKRYVENGSLMASAYANLPMVQRMPAEVTVCLNADDLRGCAGDMDVVLLEVPAALPYRGELAFLNDLPVFVGGFHLDSWKGPFWCDAAIHVDLNICVYKTVTLKVKPAVAGNGSFLWLPPRARLYDIEAERDLDVVHWGHGGREYPFRLYAFYALVNILDDGPRIRGPSLHHEYNNHLRIENIRLKGDVYQFARIHSKYGAARCNGEELAEILHRSKVNPTGSPIQSDITIPVARYIENAACGVISLTPEFHDMAELGFEHGKNIWNTTAESFYDDLAYLLTDDSLREEMAANARKLIESRHTVDIRAQQLYGELSTRIGYTGEVTECQ